MFSGISANGLMEDDVFVIGENGGGGSESATISSGSCGPAATVGGKGAFIEAVSAYVGGRHRSQIEAILLEFDESKHFNIEVDVMDILEMDAGIGEALINYPVDVVPWFDEAILRAQQNFLADGAADDYMMTLKPHVHARLVSLPTNSEVSKPNISTLRCSDSGRLVVLSGTVIRSGQLKMLEWEREYECIKCKTFFTVQCDLEDGNKLDPPNHCVNENCQGTKFEKTASAPVCIDYQEVKIQEQVQKLTMGFIPRTMPAILTNDLVNKCKAGDDITIHGTVLRRWSNLRYPAVRCDLGLFIFASHVAVTQDDSESEILTEDAAREFAGFWKSHLEQPIAGRNEILRAVCPSLYGMFPVKLCLLLSLIGGVARTEGGMKIRGESHLLLVGDAGTGKSECLRFGARIANRAVLTNGVGTTSAGLTVTALRDSTGEWILEAGALVLADGGVCCVDEFESMSTNDRTTIHEAMEQQTVSVAKAGLTCKLRTRTTVVAAINPKGRYDPDADLSVNVNLASPLLSRFDIVLILHDQQDSEWDRTVSNYLLTDPGRRSDPPNSVCSTRSSIPTPLVEDGSGEVRREGEEGRLHSFNEGVTGNVSGNSSGQKVWWTVERLRQYVRHVRRHVHPELSPEASAVLSRYYQAQRGTDGRNAARTTIRLLESLIRVAQAHARLMFRNVVLLEDAVTAVLCIESSKQTSSLVGAQPVLQADFPPVPDEEYCELEELLLTRLGLERLLCHSLRLREPAPWWETPVDATRGPSTRQSAITSPAGNSHSSSGEDRSGGAVVLLPLEVHDEDKDAKECNKKGKHASRGREEGVRGTCPTPARKTESKGPLPAIAAGDENPFKDLEIDVTGNQHLTREDGGFVVRPSYSDDLTATKRGVAGSSTRCGSEEPSGSDDDDFGFL